MSARLVFKGCRYGARLLGFESQVDYLLSVKLKLPLPQSSHLLNGDNGCIHMI